MPRVRRSRKSISSARVRGYKLLARRIDAEDATEIKSRARAAFARHERLRSIVALLRAHRLERRLTLAVVARRSGIAKPNLSRLENDAHHAPTLDTLERYARAIGMSVQIELVAADAA